ncbi:KasA/KasB family beta-ketoacyl-ACP synthase [Mycolicibacterium sp. 050158]|jgi:beta-ketoacyl ACP synthase|uniref:KasA/KasB family beta-ketoacyl-ACP synthase n=1 Tax=Mycolicibacterium sp. 050158 TaxID=3090602 RepID=UPI00299CE738|nr:KasA/KasB family beta-ketoacyl-ACP synthase [Mycolicibacterium sp. 050158]MDX1888130.1 KasA/KasB family beta-ketoacyl-ACP synthase [Mycolicibacterium sp. 050158]
MTTLRTGAGFPNVVVTAVTSTTSLATDAEETWGHLLEGRSGIRPLELPFVDEFRLPVRIGGPLLEDFDHHLNRVELRRLSYLQKMTTILSRRLWEQNELGDMDTTRLMVSIGLALGTSEEIVNQYDTFKEKGLRAVSPLAIQMYMPNSPAAAIGLERKAKAGIVTPLMADSSGAAAIAEAWRAIVFGDADFAICGGIDTWLAAVPIAAYNNLGLLSTNNDDPAGACRPFDAHRDGTVFSEGGALMLIETEEHAKARGATILARLMGAAITSDAYDDVAPDPTGDSAARAVARALELAGVEPDAVDLVTAHAPGTGPGDLAEARALDQVFDGHRPAVYGPRGALGHSWGATGALDGLVTVQALRDQVVPPTLNLHDLDPEIDLDVVAGAPRRGEYRYALTDCFGFGGYNVALVFGAA